jgi:hypothetical protein
MIPRCAGSSAAKRLRVVRPRRARWAASRRNGLRRKRTFRLLLISQADGSMPSMVPSAKRRRARHGFERQPDARRIEFIVRFCSNGHERSCQLIAFAVLRKFLQKLNCAFAEALLLTPKDASNKGRLHQRIRQIFLWGSEAVLPFISLQKIAMAAR